MLKENTTILEQDRPLSQSVLWNFQREFYKREGMEAWNWQVPFYVTSNPYIANSYASLILRFAQESIKSGKATADEPFYIVELGAGSGTFSFYTLMRLLELQRELEHIRFVYVMTDLVEKNIAFWQQHVRLKPFVEQGHLDFALFDAEKDTALNLMLSGRQLDAGENKTANPLVLLANYVFDTMRQDLFFIKDGLAMESLSTLNSPENATGPMQLEECRLKLSYREASRPYYANSQLEAILEAYCGEVNNAYMLLPSGAIGCIHNFSNISGGRLCLLASDKGYTRHLEEHLKAEPVFTLHSGCFSLPVNFDALGKMFADSGGSYYHQFTQHTLVTSLFLFGFKLSTMPEMRLAAETLLDEFGHASIFRMYEQLESTKPMWSVDAVLPFIAATRWDPHVFNATLNLIIGQTRSGLVSPYQVSDLSGIMERIANNYYPIPGAIDTFFNIGVFFQETRQYQQALDFYRRSITFNGQNEEVLFNMGLCFYFMKDKAAALSHFKSALKIEPDYIMARGWISQIEHEMC